MGSKKSIHSLISAACALALAASTFTACSSKASNSSTASDTAKQISVNITVPYSNQTPPSESENPVLQQIEKEANAKINISWTPMVSYSDKFNTMMASNQLPEMTIIPDLKSAQYVDAVHGNQFWQLDSYMSQYKNLKNIDSIPLNNAKTDGKIYALPREREMVRKCVIYRADWAKAAGLGAPDTFQKVVDMAKNFASNDYDGNGKKDTIGLGLGTVADGSGSQIDCLNELVVASGGVNLWGVKNSKVVSQYNTDEYVNTITSLHDLCAQGAISRDFAITQTTAVVPNLVDKEKCGLWITYSSSIPNLTDPLYVAKNKANLSVKITDLYDFTFLNDASGKARIAAETGLNGGIAFPKSSVKNTTRLKELLRVADYLNSQSGQLLLQNGIENREYQKTGTNSSKSLNSTLYNTEMNGLNQIGMARSYMLNNVTTDLDAKRWSTEGSVKTSSMVSDVSVPLSSATYTSSYNTLAQNIDSAEFKYILGDINLTAFKQAITSWDTAGGQKIQDEFTASYKKAQSK
jgi:putative aldouronate transport system substrate-binding protein